MKKCPNCNFENFLNTEYCEGCGESIQNVRTDFFTIIDFIKKNSEIYAVIGIFLGLFQFFFSSSDSNVKIISLFPLLVSIYLMFALILKGNQIVRTQTYENPFNRYFNANSFELWVFLSINIALVLGLIWSTGTQFVLSICLLGVTVLTFILLIRRLSNSRNITTLTIWLNLFGLFLLEIGWLIFLFSIPTLKTLTDPTLWFWTLMIPLSLLFFGIGTFLANMFIGTWIFLTESQQILENQIPYSFESLREEFRQYIQIFDDTLSMKIFSGLIILLAIGILCIYLENS
jgi:uncharacterized protein (DUF983 family)